MTAKRSGLGKGLGKGLDSLIPDNRSAKKSTPAKEKTEEAVSTGEKLVKINMIEPNREQPRRNFEEDSLLELAESIKQFGVLQPLLVQKKDGYYEIIAGERRWRAAKLAGVKEVPVIIREYSKQEVVEIALIENIQRENLNPVEEAQAYKRLMEEFSMKQDEIAERVGKSRTAVTNSIRLLKLDERVQQMLIDEMLTTGHARALLSIEDKNMQHAAAIKVFDEKLSVRETEKLVKEILNPRKEEKEKKADRAQDLVYEQLEEKIKGIIGSKVAIRRKSKDKGKIEIAYYSQDELERIVELLETIR